MPTFATYLHPHACATSKPAAQLRFVGYSLPHFNQVRQELAVTLASYPSLPIQRADLDAYLTVHSPDYLNALRALAAGRPINPPPKISIECSSYEFCLPAYQYGLGGMMAAVDRMKAGTVERAYCFALGGHHAYADWGHGYCLLNPLAAAARYAQASGFARILIVDWDLHHGDGTQSIFANDSSVYCLSIHSAADLYMAVASGLHYGTTTAAEAVGHCNIPILDRTFNDDFYTIMNLGGVFYRAGESLPAFRAALAQIPWQPDLILIFSGYDAHKDDRGRGIMDWTNEDFEQLTRAVLELAKAAACPVLSVHGGGYTLSVTISAALSHVRILAGE